VGFKEIRQFQCSLIYIGFSRQLWDLKFDIHKIINPDVNGFSRQLWDLKSQQSQQQPQQNLF